MRKKHLKVSQPFYKKRRFWILLFFILFVFFSLAFFLFSEQFYLKTLEIVCKEPISNKEKIENFIFTFFSENFLKKPHLFLKSTKNLEKSILQQNPEIETIVFSRKIPSKLIVTIKKREEVLVFCQENSCFSVDKNGIVFATSSANGAFVVESQDVSGEIVLGEKIFSQETITKILQIENEIFSKNFVPLSAKLSKNKAEFFLKEGFKLIFDLEKDVSSQLQKFFVFLENTEESKLKKIEYLDLRFNNQIFLKEKISQ